MEKQEEIVKKICFIITPIGAPESSTRKRVEQWETLIYEPTFGEEFKIIRADKISAPGFITKQILELIVNADLVIIDYTEMNPNVMYEAAVRHLVKEPFIQIYPEDQRLPFDVHNLRAISYDSNNLEYPKILSQKLKDAYEEIQKTDYKVPDILPLEFDFKNIVKDPEEFIELIKKNLVYSPGTGLATYRENISEIYEYESLGLSSAFGNSETIKCPKCGTLKRSINILSTTVSKYYRCNVCGTEFSPS